MDDDTNGPNEGEDEMTGMFNSIKNMGAEVSKAISSGPIGVAITAVTKIGEGITELLTKVVAMVIESSPYLQGVLKIIQKMFNLILMPIGNMIAKLLLPLAITMANKTIKVMEKYANAGPEEMGQAAADSFSVITDSILQMAVLILQQALEPMLEGMVSGIVNGIGQFLGGSGGGTTDYMSGLRTATDDLNDLLGESANQTASVLDQFGLTVTTGNQAVGSSTSNLATVMYSGADSIADGFQSSTSAIAIGSTQALGYLDNYNIANAGLVTTINTTTTAFSTLNDALNAYKTQTTQATNNAQNNNGDPRTVVGTDWGKFFTTPLPDMLKPGWNANIYANNTQTTNNSTNAGGNAQSGNTYITFTGNVYDKNDISAMVNKGTAAALRRAY